jgi:hypothetical protein
MIRAILIAYVIGLVFTFLLAKFLDPDYKAVHPPANPDLNHLILWPVTLAYLVTLLPDEFGNSYDRWVEKFKKWKS